MSQIVRARFRVEEVTSYANSDGKTIKMRPVTGSEGEDKAFWEATPNGELTMYISNKAVVDLFKPGDKIDVDFHVPEPVTA